jgi:hypothetical protein
MDQQEKMFALVETYQQSGQSQKEFCKEQHIKTSTFSYWIKRKRMRENPPSSFLKVDATPTLSSEGLEIWYPNGVRLKLAQLDISILSALIKLY